MTTGYVIRCAGCSEDAPLVGELLIDLSEKVVAFQEIHHHARCSVTVEPPVVLIVDAPDTTTPAATKATAAA